MIICYFVKVKKEFEKIEKEINKEFQDTEAWFKARKNFLIRLIIVAGIIAAILVLNYFMNVGS
jgi:hypothetical protein